MVDYNYKPKLSKEDYGWHGRGYLPHLDGGEFCQFITFRLFDSLPQEVLQKWIDESATDALIRRRVEGYLDSGYGACWLRKKAIASLVRDALIHHDGGKYKLVSWVIMPNHVHILLIVLAGHHLPDILHSIKSFTANKANKILRRSGQFWMHESFDRYIRDYRHYNAVIRYIENNPVKAGLCKRPEEWMFSSAYRENS